MAARVPLTLADKERLYAEKVRGRSLAAIAAELGCSFDGTSANALLPTSEGITRLRGRWFDLAVPGLARPVPTLPMFHPAFLLRTPERKREAWRDLLAVKARLDTQVTE